MAATRWWDVIVASTIVMLAAVNVIAWAPTEGHRIGAWVILAVFGLSYLAFGRRALVAERDTIVFPIFLVLVAGGLVACSPNMAVAQAVAFPLMWTVLKSTRTSIIANVALAVAVFFGFAAASGFSADGFAQGGIIEGISLVGSIALGLWITRIAELSHERKRLLDELTAAQDELAALNRDAGITSERERLAREIHDTIAQDLTGLVMLGQRARRELGDSPTLALLEESARTALAETRALVATSAPVGLSSGIRDALDRLAQRFSRETGVTVGVEVGELPALERDTEVVLLRVAQEGLANIRKHAGAESAVIELSIVDGKPTLAVRDDGAGFNPEQPTPGFGLGGMRDRLALVGGALEVASSSDGTILTATLPAVAS